MTMVLVTGANGHIGCHVVRAALERGWTPVAFVRRSSDRRALTGLDVEVREGDVLDAGTLEAAMRGVDVVVHVAAVHRNFATDSDTIIRPAVEGTRNVLTAARAAKVRRVVYTSTGATVGFAKDPARPLDEASFKTHAKAAYIRGKIEAECVLRDAAAGASAPEIVILNPSGVFGPRDYRLTPASRALVSLLQGDPVFLHLCASHVADVGRAHVLAAERGVHGERYLVTGENLAPADTAALVRELGGKRPPTFRPPDFALRFLIGRMEKKAAREGADAPASRDALDDLEGGQLVYDSTKSRRVLGMTYRPAREVFRDSFRWLLHVGALKPRIARRLRNSLGEAAAPDPDWV